MKASDNVFPKLIASEGAAPATPALNTVVLYAKADGRLYLKDDAGVEIPAHAPCNAVTYEFTADANITLTAAEYWTSCLVLTDSPATLTVGRDVVFPAAFPMMLVRNATAQTLTLKKSGQVGVTVVAGAKAVIASGPTDVEKA